MTINVILTIVTGFAGGLAVGSGFVAFMVVFGIIPRLTQLTKTQKYIRFYEWGVVLGAIGGTFASLRDPSFSFPAIMAFPVGLASGIFVGMLAAALTEVLNVFPILAKRVRSDDRIILLMMAFVLGKIVGSLIQWIYLSD